MSQLEKGASEGVGAECPGAAQELDRSPWLPTPTMSLARTTRQLSALLLPHLTHYH